MPLEIFSFITSLNNNNPAGTDGLNQSDDHQRGVKTTLLNSFPNIDAAVTASPADLNQLTGTAAGGSGIATTGMISMFYGTTAPNSWLLCNGVAIPAEHTALIALVGANTPNLMGQFVRGWSIDNTVDPEGGRAPGDLQTEDFLAHTHDSSGSDVASQNAPGDNGSNAKAALGAATASAGGAETRPVNMALAFIIKV